MSNLERKQREAMDNLHREARKMRVAMLEREAVDDARFVLSNQKLHPDVAVRLAFERLAICAARVEGLRDA